MSLIAAVVLVVLTVPLAGGGWGPGRCAAAAGVGDLRRAGAGDRRHRPARAAGGVRAALMVAAYPLLAVFLAANWRLPGMPVVALGGALNLLAIAVNGGVMPATPAALAGAGLDPAAWTGEHS